MPSWPNGVQTATITFGKGITVDGNVTSATLTVTPIFNGTKAVKWTADSTPLLPFTVKATAEAGAYGSVQVPVVDQTGWKDDGQNAYSMWAYKLEETPKFGSTIGAVRTKYVQPLAGQTVIDFDDIPDGSVGLPSSAPVVPVTSVNGQTGAVVVNGGTGGGAAISDTATSTTTTWSSTKIAAGDAAAKDRGNHTGTQAATTITGLAPVATSGLYSDLSGKPTIPTTSAGITDFVEAVQDAVAGFFVDGANITHSYNDGANTFTVTASGAGGGTTDPEVVRDTIGAAMIGLGNIAVTVNDAADTITITTSATVNSTDAALRDRSTHTGTQAATTITGLAAVATSGSYADLTGKPTGTNAFADQGYDLIILAGQSNMSGRGTPYNTALTDLPNTNVAQWVAGGTQNIAAAGEPLAFQDGNVNGIGPGYQFARWYSGRRLRPGRAILLVPVAVGGTPLSSAATSSWRRGVSGNNYANMITQTNAALTKAATVYTTAGANRVVAVLWQQGETDGDNSVTGAQYQTDLDALITGLRTDLSLPNLPFIIGTMVPEYLTSGTRAAINAVHRDTPNRIARTDVAVSGTNMNKGDGNHFNGVGARYNGKAMFDAYERIAEGIAPYSEVNSSATTAPGQVTALSATAGNGQSVLSWTAPTNNGGSAITDYTVQYRTAAGPGAWTTFTHTASTAATQTVTGLTNGTSYDFQVAAVNTVGTGAYSSTATTTPTASTDTTAPTTPTNLAAGTPTSSSVPLSWTASTDNVAVTGYKVRRGGTVVGTPTGTSYNDTGLAAATAYSYTVSAVDAAGNESAQTAAVSATTAAAAATPVVSDTFNRADSATTLGAADTGQTWSNTAGTWGISSNQAYVAASAGSPNIALIDSGIANQTVQATYVTGAAGGDRAAFVFRAVDGANFWMLQSRGSGVGWRLYKNVSGTLTQVGTDAATPAPADPSTFKAVCLGSSITVSIGGTTIFSITDAANSTGTKAGFWTPAGTPASRFDNFSVAAS